MRQDPLQEILKRLARLEKGVAGNAPIKANNEKPMKLAEEGLPAQILKLRGHGFFKEPKTANEVQSKLQPTYHCELDRVAMALLRLQRRKKLRKSSKMLKKIKQVAYVW